MVMKERDEELAMFLEMRRGEQENERNCVQILPCLDEIDVPLGSGFNPLGSPMSKILASVPTPKTAEDEFLDSENDKTDYEWLLSPPDTTLLPSLKLETNGLKTNHTLSSYDHPAALTSLVGNVKLKATSNETAESKHPSLPCEAKSFATVQKKSSSSGSLTSSTRRTSTPIRSVLTASTNKPTRSSTPSRVTWPSNKPAGPTVRSSTPNQVKARSSTPIARSSSPAPKLTSKTSLPKRRPSLPSEKSSASAPPGRSSSASKSRATMSDATVLSGRPVASSDAIKNLKTSAPERPASASKVRPVAPNPRSLLAEAGSRRRASSGNAHGSERSLSRSRRHPNGSDDVNPVIMGTKMVERIVNMRKLAPPKQDSYLEILGNPVSKFSSMDNSGFGRTLSKKSLDMAMRHMDITGSIPGSLRSVRLGHGKGHKTGASESPLATRSNASSELSGNSSNSTIMDGSEVEDNDLGSCPVKLPR